MSNFEQTRQTLIRDTDRQLQQAADLFAEIRQSPYKQIEHWPIMESGKQLYATYQSPFVILPRQDITFANGRKLNRQPAVSLRLWHKHPEHTGGNRKVDAFSFVMYGLADPSKDKGPYLREELFNVSGEKLSLISLATRGFTGIFPAIRADKRRNDTPENWLVFRSRGDGHFDPLDRYVPAHRAQLKLGKLLLSQTANALRNRKLNPRGR